MARASWAKIQHGPKLSRRSDWRMFAKKKRFFNDSWWSFIVLGLFGVTHGGFSWQEINAFFHGLEQPEQFQAGWWQCVFLVVEWGRPVALVRKHAWFDSVGSTHARQKKLCCSLKHISCRGHQRTVLSSPQKEGVRTFTLIVGCQPSYVAGLQCLQRWQGLQGQGWSAAGEDAGVAV